MTKPAPGPDQPPVPVRLVTFNTHHGVGDDGRHDLVRIAELLAAMLAFDPADRPTAAEVAGALEPVVADLPRRLTLTRRGWRRR